jgi:sucrose-6-phosphate hydrolase SacC (GH32 family)
VVWDEVSQKWIMSLFMDVGYDFGLFSSSDLKEWKYLSTVSIEGVRECPGFESLPVDGDMANKKWIFCGANGNYVIGSFDGTNFIPETKVLRGDYGINFYAAQTWDNVPDGRCLQIAWMPTQPYPDMPFEQQMNFPTEVTIRTTPEGLKAFRMPVREIQNLYDKEYKWEDYVLKQGDNLFEELKGELYDVDMVIDVKKSSSFEVKLRNVTVFYDAVKKVVLCGGKPVNNGIIPDTWISANKKDINSSNNLGMAPLYPVDGIIKLKILFDRTSVEVFGNDGETVITSCYMPEDDNLNYSLTTNGEINVVKAQVHSLKSAWIK